MKKVKSILMFAFILTVFAIIFCFNTSAAETVSSGADSTTNQQTWQKADDGDIEYNFNKETGVMVIRGNKSTITSEAFGIPFPLVHKGLSYEHYLKASDGWDFEDGGSLDASDFEVCYVHPDAEKTKILIIEDSVVKLEPISLLHFENAEVIILSENITEIPIGTFHCLENLKTVVLSSKTTKIDEYAFFGCKNLKTINFPSTLEYVGRRAFYGCNFDNEKFPDTIKTIEEGNKLIPDDLKDLKAKFVAATDVELEWEHVRDGLGYRIYEHVNGKWQKIKDVRSYNRCIVNYLEPGKKYTFAVRPFNVIEYTEGDGYFRPIKEKLILANNYKKITVTAPPKNTELKVTATQTTSSVTLKWNKIAGATDYRIYAYRKGAWKKLTDTSSLTYTEKKLNSGSTYKYRIEPLHKFEGDIVWSTKKKEIETSTKPVTSTLKVSSTAKNKAVLNWSNPAGENGFEIYYSTKKDSGFKKYTTTKANVKKATVSKLTSGKTYYFKVRSFKTTKSGKAYSAYSAVKSVKIK